MSDEQSVYSDFLEYLLTSFAKNIILPIIMDQSVVGV